jgi:RNA polymerase sigma-70 factor, ECF subfamily
MKQQVVKQQFTELYTAEADKLFRYCVLRVSDRDQAVDIAQDAFTRLWDSVAAGEDIHNLRSFLFKIAHNLIIDWYRKKKAISLDALLEPEDEALRFQLVDEHQQKPEIGADGRMMLEKIQFLDATYQHVVYLRFVEDLSPKEIAEIVKLDVNVVSVRINRGLNELRKMLNINIKNNE